MDEITDPNSNDAEIIADELPEELSIDAIEAAYRQALEASESVDPEVELDDDTEDVEYEDSNAEEYEYEEFAEDEDPDPDAIEEEDSHTQISEKDVIEALLFVGSESLTSKKIAGTMSENTKPESIEQLISQLNSEYETQNRPYRIELHEGGYQMSLTPDFERIRQRVYGTAPKEVRLSQEAVEVLSIVAYRQPISRADVDRISDRNAGSLLNQLLRRRLIVIESKGKSRNDVTYATTDRFLQVFGLGQLTELPQADELDMK